MNEKTIFLFIFVSSSAYLVIGWEPEPYNGMVPDIAFRDKGEFTQLNKTIPYCYHFTWMGTKFNKWTFKNIKNKTCNQYFKDKKTLCINPMVATEKGGEPDIDYILNYHYAEATCKLSQEQVCIKYTVTQNGLTSYQTRYCSHVNIEMEGPMKSGCIQEKRGSELIEVCVCRSDPGPHGICNSAFHPTGITPLISVLSLCSIYLLYKHF